MIGTAQSRKADNTEVGFVNKLLHLLSNESEQKVAGLIADFT